MEEDPEPVLVYGLEVQSRALSAAVASTPDGIRFAAGTQIPAGSNFVHFVEVDEDLSGVLIKHILGHPVGEVWDIACHRSLPNTLVTAYSSVQNGKSKTGAALWKIPDETVSSQETEGESLQLLSDVDPACEGREFRMVAWDPSEREQLSTVTNSGVHLYSVTNSSVKLVCSHTTEENDHMNFTCGRWNPTLGASQIATGAEGDILGWDIRTMQHAFSIPKAHSQMIRDIDFNPNRPYRVVSCGEDGCVRFWDVRSNKEPLLSRRDHSHWVWSVRFNAFHDHLVISGGSDARVLLLSTPSVSSELYGKLIDENDVELCDVPKAPEEDKILAKFEEHEDSVYCVEWATADPWVLASLSYDGRLIFNRNWESFNFHTEIPDACLKEPCILGIDEAGRGPVLGPMVYAAAFCPGTKQDDLKKLDVADSKTLTEAKREKLLENSVKSGFLGFVGTVLSPNHISNGMLRRAKYNLNSMSHDTAIGLIQTALDRGVQVTEVFLDTVGPPDKYKGRERFILDRSLILAPDIQENITGHLESLILAPDIQENITGHLGSLILAPDIQENITGLQKRIDSEAEALKLEAIFPTMAVTVSKKADSLFPIVSAASICAKVTRDSAVNNWHFENYILEKAGKPKLGSGYPGDPTTKAFLREYLDPVFGFPSVVRFSWSTASSLLDQHAIEVTWEEMDDEEEDGIKSQKITSFFTSGTGSRKRKRDAEVNDGNGFSRKGPAPPPHAYFTQRCLVPAAVL
ncbi:unnamed protein product [Cyprideis torosa]|uniref:Ribonuclease n=1 Tax=Cyprideis torosa TaxID=163714 RepID=A0A7R8WBY6_9CRUS|nr:unnamed protein product [Cyprideis torosa]CAG0892605.1 unnamed protein product [Cyprideis torosa]